jgi:hypothetical protein
MKNIVLLVAVAALAAACQQPQPPDPRIVTLVDRQAIRSARS